MIRYFDLDGVICEDNDLIVGAIEYVNYLKYIVQPLNSNITKQDSIITGRLEIYREITENWLKEYNIEYNELIMKPNSLEGVENTPAFKAEYYLKDDAAKLFIESSVTQAEKIAKLTNKIVFCTDNQKYYCYPKQTDDTFLNEYYSDFLEDKNVILVGPAAYLIEQKKGEVIDKYDIVVRMNNALPMEEKYLVDYGKRTDILYHGLFASGFPTQETVDYWEEVGVQWLISKAGDKIVPRHKKFSPLIKNKDILWIDARKNMASYKGEIKRSPSQGLITIKHLLQFPLKTLSIIGLDFYQSGYFVGYKNLDTEEKVERQRKINQAGKVHDMLSQSLFLQDLCEKDNRIIIDEVLEEIFKKKEERIKQQKMKEDWENKFPQAHEWFNKNRRPPLKNKKIKENNKIENKESKSDFIAPSRMEQWFKTSAREIDKTAISNIRDNKTMQEWFRNKR